MISRTWFAGVAMLSSLGMFVPSRVLAQHGPGRHGPDSALVYDTNSEETFKGIVTEVKMGRSALYWLSQIHTLGLGHKGEQEKQLVMKTDTDTVEIHLGPTAFLTERKMDIGKGDALEVTGSHATIAQAHVVLAREIRKADSTWTLRDATGQPLWGSVETEARGFWTTKRVLLAAIVIKVVVIRVTDDGLGIPERQMASLFKPFFRVDRSRPRRLAATVSV